MVLANRQPQIQTSQGVSHVLVTLEKQGLSRFALEISLSQYTAIEYGAERLHPSLPAAA